MHVTAAAGGAKDCRPDDFLPTWGAGRPAPKLVPWAAAAAAIQAAYCKPGG